MTSKTLQKIADVPRKQMADGLSIAQLNHDILGDFLDPYLMFDHFQMKEPFFHPHPHAGFSAVTYMFPESKNGFQNRDSRGDQHKIPAGAIHWTAAGRGIVHEEVPIERGLVCEGLQVFVNHHSSKKLMEPKVFHLDPDEVKVIDKNGVKVRVVVGKHDSVESTLKPPTDVLLLDVWLNPGAIFEHSFNDGERGFIYFLKGHAHVGPIGDCHELHESRVGGFTEEGDVLQVAARDVPVHFVIGAGKPLNEKVIFYGPFCMNTKEQIQEAIQSYQSGQMGQLESSF